MGLQHLHVGSDAVDNVHVKFCFESGQAYSRSAIDPSVFRAVRVLAALTPPATESGQGAGAYGCSTVSSG